MSTCTFVLLNLLDSLTRRIANSQLCEHVYVHVHVHTYEPTRLINRIVSLQLCIHENPCA